MVGQEKLLNRLHSYSVSTLPKSMLILGDKGSGKHLIVDDISKHLNLEVVDITDKLTLECLDEINVRCTPTLYLINANGINERQQNVILKFLEEPAQSTYIVLISESISNLLQTVVNRCVRFELEHYTRDELVQFINDDIDKELALNICNTPGQIELLHNINLKDMYDLCNKIIDKLNIANYSNTLTISNKLNYKDEYNKFDVYLFLKTLTYLIFERYKSTKDIKMYNRYLIVDKYANKLVDKRLSKSNIIELMLTELWLFERN